jgi:hypothetical protein
MDKVSFSYTFLSSFWFADGRWREKEHCGGFLLPCTRTRLLFSDATFQNNLYNYDF